MGRVPEEPSVVQLANAPTVAKSLLARTAEGLRLHAHELLGRMKGSIYVSSDSASACSRGLVARVEYDADERNVAVSFHTSGIQALALNHQEDAA